MENLEELRNYSSKLRLQNVQGPIKFDYSDSLILAVYNQTLIVYDESEISENEQVHKIETSNPLKYVKYLTMYSTVFLATDTQLILYDIDQRTILTQKNVNAIVELSWNHLETLFVVIDSNNLITSYNCTRNIINPKDTVQLSAPVPIPALVGWGSQRTQFQGPKQTRSTDIKVEELDQTSIAPPKISWRGNSELFVVNYCEDGQRFLKVFNSDLQPMNMSEAYPNLQEPVAFMGQGQCIACCSIGNDNTKLVIFEKNCKVKAEYNITQVTDSVKKIQYHPIMNMLAVSFTDKNRNTFINVYLFSNGEWIFKQQLFYPSDCTVYDFTWLKLHENLYTTCTIVVYTSKYIEHHYYRFVVSRCPLTGTVAVVNGKKLEIYLYDKKITPPPLYFTSCMNERPINRVLFHPTRKICVCIDSYCYVKLLNITDEGIVEEIGYLNNYTFTGAVKFLSVDWNESSVNVSLANETRKGEFNSQFNDILVNVYVNDDITDSNVRLPYNDTSMLASYKHIDEPSNFIYLTKHELEENKLFMDFEFALSANRDFYVNDSPVCGGVTSFYIFQGYLIFTHSSAKLYCMRLKDYVLFTSIIQLSNIFSREIEQGATILACTNLLFPQIILQLPRGNIETIGCKLMTIDLVEKLLNEGSWEEAIRIIRTEKVNWNVLIDLNPERFNDHIEDFVKATRNNTMLSNIVTEFNTKENCFDTFYKNYSPKDFNGREYDKKRIIHNILQYLSTTDCIQNLSSIVAIQQKHISLRAALKSIKDIYEVNRHSYEQICSKAIKQLLSQEYFKDLESAAYNLYDLDFLRLIYHNSLEDPKVYEPEIKNFKAMGALERRFKMSLRGRNLNSSVKYLLRSDTVEDSYIINFIIKNRLESVAYFSLNEYHKHFVLVSELYANKLSISKRFTEAGIVMKRAGLFDEALQEFTKGLQWREITSLCTTMKLTSEEADKVYKNLAAELVKAKHLDEAVIVLETYAKDYLAAINVLVENRSFRKAVCLAETYREDDLIRAAIQPKLLEYTAILNEKINRYKEQFKVYTKRLQVVRQERAYKLQAVSLGQYEDEDLYPMSETSTFKSKASSHQTSKSRSSTMSSKNRRKEEKKKIDLKEGGFYEDIALMRVLHILYNEVFEFGEEIKEICLVCFNKYTDVGKKLHSHFGELHTEMVKSIPDVWCNAFVNEDDPDEFYLAAIIQNKQDLDPQYSVPPATNTANSWKLEIFS
ncbi:unnamed protein product [Phyllotreta striolata]|uniref:Elongator complex protein 1 n=1 Tax=Phyllotreta striolata TaxID=444603 RepID=A0A9N9TY00_PHYSR|nr:unnamed protein product [Phyllotreta striolata]